MVNDVLERYGQYQKGDYTIVVEQTPSRSGAAPKSDLIDFFGDDSSTTAAPSNPGNDLGGLFGPASTSPTATTPFPPPVQHNPRTSITAGFNQQPTQP
ncbi:hypothetical protein FRC12_001336 [Ceratobasidium sp. 428]|nr:hypothetical protein FRC12_001336 [Ceratobasidium sp. 428]